MNDKLTSIEDVATSLPFQSDSLSVKSAQDLISECVSPVSAIEKVLLYSSIERVLAEDIVSPISVPGFDNAAMDGFAFSSENLDFSVPITLEIVGFSLAGHPFLGKIRSGECIRIMTGAAIPEGCDTVVQQENIKVIDKKHLLLPVGAVAPGDNVRLTGENIRKGSTVLVKGTVLQPAHLGVLASINYMEVPVYRKIKVAVLSTGDELQLLGTILQNGNFYDSNRAVLVGLLTRLGCDVVDIGIAKDNPDDLEKTLQKACEMADAVVTTGGISVGAADYTKQVMAKMGDIAFYSVKMRPGRPMAFGRICLKNKHVPLFGLPGNPVAVMVSFYFFVRNALLRMMGANPSPLLSAKAQAETDLSKRVGRTEFQRGIAVHNTDGHLTVSSTGEQGSGILRSMTQANCIIVLPEERGKVHAGEWVDVIFLEGLV